VLYPMTGFGFSKQQRLLTAREFQRVFDQLGLKCSSKRISLLAASNLLGYPRIGFIIPKKQIRLAVQRNRIKRVIRESFRQLDTHGFSYDVIVLVRKGLDEQQNSDITAQFEYLWAKLKQRAKNSNAITADN